MREVINRFRILFFKELDSKPSWGNNSIKELFTITLVNALLGEKEDDTR